MLGAISEVDLIAKEFKKHDTCYRDYTRPSHEVDTAAEEKNAAMYDRGNYEAVCKVVSMI